MTEIDQLNYNFEEYDSLSSGANNLEHKTINITIDNYESPNTEDSSLRVDNQYVIDNQNTTATDVHEIPPPTTIDGSPNKLEFCNLVSRLEKLESKIKLTIDNKKYRNTSKTCNSIKARKSSDLQEQVNTNKQFTNACHSSEKCKICGDKASKHIHYGGKSCHSCRAFFRRCVNKFKRSVVLEGTNVTGMSPYLGGHIYMMRSYYVIMIK